MDDSEIVAACLRGEKGAFRRIMDAHAGSALALAFNVLRNRQDAEDVCQEAFVQAYRHLGRFDGRAKLRTWLLTIVYRRSLDVLKRRRRFRLAVRLAGREVIGGPGLEEADPVAGSDARILPSRWLEVLTPRERTALCLWADEGLTAAEIAGVLGCAAATARVTLFNARRKIKALMENAHAAH